MSLRTPEWKVIYDTKADSWSAYHLLEDPGETRNRFPEDLAQVQSLRVALETWQSELEPAFSEPAPPPLGDDEREQLRSLGYLAEDSERAEDPERADDRKPANDQQYERGRERGRVGSEEEP